MGRCERDGDTVKYFDDNGELHREDGPARIKYVGDYVQEKYYRHGLLHREDGPAVLDKVHGYRAWYLNDDFHRINGPAVTYLNGSKIYYICGELLGFDELTLPELIAYTKAVKEFKKNEN